MGTFESVLQQYEKNKQAAGGNKFASQEERMKKYFTTVLPKNTSDGERRIRILPMKDGTSPFVEVKFHELQVDGKWVKLYDPAQDGEPSPLNEVYNSLMSTGLDSDKDIARSYRSRKFYIVKVIDRDKENDGPKFWRFKHNAKQEGILDKIIPIFKNRGDITDPEKGRDLILSLSLTKSNNGKEYTQVSSIIPDDIGPLSTNEEQKESWVNDELTWSDVYSKKPFEYLEMVANGETPRWDNDVKKWVSDSQSETSVGGGNEVKTTPQSNVTTSKSPIVNTPEIEDPQSDDDEDDDLPF